MLSKTECSYTTSNTPSVIGVTSFTYGNGRRDVLSKITLPDGQTFTPTHDIVGNPSHVMTGNGNRYAATWSYGRRLTGLSSGSEAFSYSYNADGIRTAKTVNGVKHTYALSGTTILNEEWTENGVQHLLMYVYDANGSPTGMVYRNSTMSMGVFEEYLFVKNIQGDILHVYNSAGKKLVSYVYDAWGNIISTTYSNGGGTSAARFNPFTYRGYYRDSETGMYYLNSRYYNPKMGRFISADTTDVLSLPYHHPGQYNLFSYCNNNPVNDIDDDGQLSWLAKIAIGAAAIAVGVGVTVLTGGAALPALVAGVKAACVAGAISAGTSAATTAVRSAVSGDSFSTVVQKSANAAVDGFADGFMAGGIAAGASQVASGGFKIAANLGAKTGRNGRIKLGDIKLSERPSESMLVQIHYCICIFPMSLHIFRLVQSAPVYTDG